MRIARNRLKKPTRGTLIPDEAMLKPEDEAASSVAVVLLRAVIVVLVQVA